MSDNHVDEANSRVKDGAGSFTRDKTVKGSSLADQARTTVQDKGNSLVDALPGRGSE